MFPDPEQIEIEFPDDEPDYLYEHDMYVVEEQDHYSHFFDDPVDIDWDYGDDSEDQEFMSE